ncbi:unnamed protein product [Brugia timori]|uniref:Transposase n=1 Tax=Brugia timori TaxID=42155 RepID=A0A0R3QIK5_9BILA|nr:unnamed protein product [Brugia timori]
MLCILLNFFSAEKAEKTLRNALDLSYERVSTLIKQFKGAGETKDEEFHT